MARDCRDGHARALSPRDVQPCGDVPSPGGAWPAGYSGRRSRRELPGSTPRLAPSLLPTPGTGRTTDRARATSPTARSAVGLPGGTTTAGAVPRPAPAVCLAAVNSGDVNASAPMSASATRTVLVDLTPAPCWLTQDSIVEPSRRSHRPETPSLPARGATNGLYSRCLIEHLLISWPPVQRVRAGAAKLRLNAMSLSNAGRHK